MSTPPLNLNPSKTSRASSKPIGSLATESKDALGLSSATTTSSSSSLRTPKSSVSRKKPPGLDISRSIPSRAAPPNPGAPPNGTPASSRSNYHSKLSEQLAGLELADSKREKLDLKTEDLKVIGDLGAGNGGTVTKVIHAGTGLTMAKKVSDRAH
jgi:mitogen-activated protein kinase kinase